MQRQHVRRLPVVADGRLIGIITWGDLRAAQPSAATTLSVYEARALLDKVTVAACMTHDPLTVAALIDPSLLTWQRRRLRPSIEDGVLRLREEAGAPEVDVAVAVQAEPARRFIVERLLRLP